jgi:outer membrane immunogenic protein
VISAGVATHRHQPWRDRLVGASRDWAVWVGISNRAGCRRLKAQTGERPDDIKAGACGTNQQPRHARRQRHRDRCSRKIHGVWPIYHRQICPYRATLSALGFAIGGMGMKKRLLMSVAVGALVAAAPAMAQPPTPVPAVPIYNWTGFYGGLNVGWSWGNGAVTYTDPLFKPFGLPVSSISGPSFLDGAIGGFQGGYNWQVNTTWVAGLEADFQWTGEVANGSFFFPVDGEGRTLNASLGSQILWFGTVRGRVGWLYTPDILVYATGGLAYGKVDVSGSFATHNPNGGWSFNQSTINTGWTVGGGVEGNVQHLPNVTWKVEYLYVDLGSISGGGVDSFGFPYSFGAKFTDNIFRVGLNWH